jgi:hypothetical protein
MHWSQLEQDFEPDGSVREIYVLGTTSADWQGLLDRLHDWKPRPSYAVDHELSSLPRNVADAFSAAREGSVLLRLNVEGLELCCHFFKQDQIEFDLDPAEISGPKEIEAISGFMRFLGQLTGKPVILTPENAQDLPILRCSPETLVVEWVEPQAGAKPA